MNSAVSSCPRQISRTSETIAESLGAAASGTSRPPESDRNLDHRQTALEPVKQGSIFLAGPKFRLLMATSDDGISSTQRGRRSNAVATSTYTPIGSVTTVISLQWMTAQAEQLLGIHCRRANPAQNIDRVGYGLNVVGIYAAAHTTKMIQHQTVRNFAPHGLIDSAMSANLVAIASNPSVAVSVDVAEPQPATRIGFRRNARHQSFKKAPPRHLGRPRAAASGAERQEALRQVSPPIPSMRGGAPWQVAAAREIDALMDAPMWWA